ncbi:MAG: hypothetical protein RRC34_04100 [Lentisphaeria bacterium]|nr:hypothetical protein [Lentisphaeria bacterium]
MKDTDIKLNDTLRRWQAEQTPETKHMEHLNGRIRHAIRKGTRNPVPAPSGVGTPFAPFLGRLAYSALGMAAILTLLLVVHLREEEERTSNGHRPAFADSAQSLAALDGEVLAEAAMLFREMNASLADRLKWVAETDEDVQVATIDQDRPGGLPEEGPLVLVRTLVLSRPSSGGRWRSDWRAQVVTRAQEMVQVDLGGDAASLTIWTFPVNGEAVAVDSQLKLKGTLEIESSVSEILLSAHPAGIHTFFRDGREYRVMQVATVLANQRGQAI